MGSLELLRAQRGRADREAGHYNDRVIQTRLRLLTLYRQRFLAYFQLSNKFLIYLFKSNLYLYSLFNSDHSIHKQKYSD